MSYLFKLRNTYEFDFAAGSMKITGYRTQFNNDGRKIGRVGMLVNTTTSKLMEFCKICILSQRGESAEVKLADYGISYRRETFYDRYFYSGDLQMAQGEVYIIYEILRHKIDTDKVEFFKHDNIYFYICKSGHIIIMDRTCLNVGVFRYGLFELVRFSIDDKVKGSQIGYDIPVSVGKIQSVTLKHGVCHPYVYLKYRDLTLSVSYDTWCALQNFCSYYTYSEI